MAEDEADGAGLPLQEKPFGTPKLALKSDNQLHGSQTQLRRMAEKRLLTSLDELRQFHDSMTLSWKGVDVFAPVKSGRKCGGKWFGKRGGADTAPKQILTDVSGVVEPGTLLAIMGASGAGKTTLLNVLTHRNTQRLTVEGRVCVNGQCLGPGITAVSAYVQQMDLFIGSLKVREHLWFCAQLRMEQQLDNEAKRARVEEVLTELGLSRVADSVIGTPGKAKGISGGEKKRLAFASEILVDPGLMFCDEPTSGLDAFMAQSVVETLKQMASKGKTIVCTIHQPASEVYALFDRILLLAEGRTAFMGPASQALEYFKSVGYECPVNFNPADFFIHTLAVMPGEEAKCREIIRKVCNEFEGSHLFSDIRNDVDNIHSEPEKDVLDAEVQNLKTLSLYKVSALKQLKVVFWRCWLVNLREPMLMRARVVQSILGAVVLGLIFLRQPLNQKGIMNINGALFIMLLQAAYTNILAVLNTFPVEFPVYRREHSNGMYRPSVYFLCKSFSEMPIFVLLPFVYTAIIYWIVGLHSDATTFFVCAITIALCTNISVSFSYVISISAGSVSLALAIAPIVFIPLMLFGGFFLNSGSVPVYFIWLEYLSWLKYGQEVLVVNQWQNIGNISCDGSGTGGLVDMITNITSTVMPHSGDSTTPCFSTGQQVIDSLSFSQDKIGMDFLAMVLLLLGFRILSYLLLLLKSGERK